jgi:hypothetical protein
VNRAAATARISASCSNDVLAGRQRVHGAAARSSFDERDQVELARGISELRPRDRRRRGELEFWSSPPRSRQLVIGVKGVAGGGDTPGAAREMVAAWRLIGLSLESDRGDGRFTFTRALFKSAPKEEVSRL